MAEDNIPANRRQLIEHLHASAAQRFDDPVVEVQQITGGEFRIRVGQGDRGPRYFRVKVTEER